MIVLGIDPGSRSTGYGVIAQRDGAVSLLECGVIRTQAEDELPARLLAIFEGVGEVLDRHTFDAVAVERAFHGKNARSSLLLGHARAAAILAATLRGLPIAEYSPAEIKVAVSGTGRATKEQVQYMVQQRLRLRTPPTPSDAADGVAIALCHCGEAALHAFVRRAT